MSPDQPLGSETDRIVRRAFHRTLLIALLVVLLLVLPIAVLWLRPTDGVGEQERAPQAPQAPPAPSSVELPALPFTDITNAAGIDFVHVNGAEGERLLPEALGSGGGFLDYDRDGDPDVLLINSRPWSPSTPTTTMRLYRNDGARFVDVTGEAGLDIETYGMGLAVGDVDADGWPDLYVTALGRNLLLRNDAGRFVAAPGAADIAGEEDAWSTGAAFFDYDRDGDLDLYVVNYVRWTRAIDLEIDFRVAGIGRAYGAPDHFAAAADRLYRNDGSGRFADVSAAAGVDPRDPATGRPVGKGLAVLPLDYDDDGHLDLFVANDTDRNFLFHNDGDAGFEEVGALEGVAYDRSGKATGAMGVDAGWFRNDPDLGIAVGNFANEMSSLYVTAEGRPPFFDEAILEGLGPDSRLGLTFGMLFIDVDLDGRLDLLQANGHLESEIGKVQPSQSHAQPAQLFWNCGEGCARRFQQVADGGDLARPRVGRALAYADIDDDGDLDLLVTQNAGPAALLRNDQDRGHHWLRLLLRTRGRNRDAIGAVVELSGTAGTQRRMVMPTRSYLSTVELPVTFGLGDDAGPVQLTVTWPDGSEQSLRVETVDRLVELRRESAPP